MERDNEKYYYRTRIINGREYVEKTLKSKSKARANKRYAINPDAVKKQAAERYELHKEELKAKWNKKTLDAKQDRKCKLCPNIISRERDAKTIYCSVRCNSANSYKNNGHKWTEQRRKYKKHKYNTDIMQRLRERTRTRLYNFFKFKEKTKSKTTLELIGCEWDVLKEHIEKQFVDGMSWDRIKEIHVDHFVPLTSAKNEEELIKLCNYKNLRPMWAIDNLRKGSKINYHLTKKS